MKKDNTTNLYKAMGVLWSVAISNFRLGDGEYISFPICPNPTCHIRLDNKTDSDLYCANCRKVYPIGMPFSEAHSFVQKKFEGYKTFDHPIYSLDLPPTKVIDEDNEDENYWVQARIVEKDGKKMAVIYFGEKKKIQKKKDYVQMFVDFEEDQIRFDKGNKNPMQLLAAIRANFQETSIEVKKTHSEDKIE